MNAHAWERAQKLGRLVVAARKDAARCARAYHPAGFKDACDAIARYSKEARMMADAIIATGERNA